MSEIKPHKFTNFSIFVNLWYKCNFFMIYYLYALLLIWFAKIKILAALRMLLRSIHVYFYHFCWDMASGLYWPEILGDLWICMYFYFFLCMNMFTNTCIRACTQSSTRLSCFMCMNINTGYDSMQRVNALVRWW